MVILSVVFATQNDRFWSFEKWHSFKSVCDDRGLKLAKSQCDVKK